METKASVKYVRVSAQKAGMVLKLIRRKPVNQAFNILKNTHKKSAPIIDKLLHSVVTNATENHGMMVDDLFILKAVANEGPTMKRYRPRAKGRADHKLKRTSIIELVVSDEKFEKGVKKHGTKG